jgi:hypothetical protein
MNRHTIDRLTMKPFRWNDIVAVDTEHGQFNVPARRLKTKPLVSLHPSRVPPHLLRHLNDGREWPFTANPILQDALDLSRLLREAGCHEASAMLRAKLFTAFNQWPVDMNPPRGAEQTTTPRGTASRILP